MNTADSIAGLASQALSTQGIMWLGDSTLARILCNMDGTATGKQSFCFAKTRIT